MLFRAEALFNAVKKQYGLHSFLLPLQLPSPPPPPVPVPALPPRLPTLSSHDSPSLIPQPSTDGSSLMPGLTPPRPPASPMPRQPGPPPLTNKTDESSQPPAGYQGSTVHLTQDDIHQIGRFVREFVTMSLVPWMEKCVVEWNESVSALVSIVMEAHSALHSTPHRGDFRRASSPPLVGCSVLPQQRHLQQLRHMDLVPLYHRQDPGSPMGQTIRSARLRPSRQYPLWAGVA